MELDPTIIELATKPIPGDSPCGINAKYEPAYEQLEAEVAKSESISAGSTDWTVVHSLAKDILANNSKDYSIACYITYCLCLENGYNGLLNGIGLLKQLSETYWDDMFPPKKRLRGRQNSSQWLIEKVAVYIEANEPNNDQLAFIPALAAAVKDLDFFLSEKMEDKAPSFVDVNRQLKRLKQVAESSGVTAATVTQNNAEAAPVNDQPTSEPKPAAAPEAQAQQPAPAAAQASANESSQDAQEGAQADAEIIALATNPIAGDSAVGINAKYEPAFEQLEAELAKSESISSESTDWDIVQNLSKDILANTSKDFSVACYLAYTLSTKNRYQGLIDGFGLLKAMSETYWDDMFPPKKRLRGRQNSMQWFLEKVAQFIEANEPNANEMSLVSDLATTVKDFDFYLSEKMEDKTPSFVEVNRPLKRLKQVAASAPPPQAEAPVAATPEPAAPQANEEKPAEEAPTSGRARRAARKAAAASSGEVKVEEVSNVGSDNEAKKAYRSIQDGLKKLAEFYGEAKASDPRRFRLNRSALWDNLDKLPPNTDGKTQLPAPPADKLKKVKEAFDAGNYEDALNLAEKSASKLPYWFDGNRYMVMAMEQLGAEYDAAREALTSEVSQLFARLPKLFSLAYSNGDSFADAETLSWLESLNQGSGGPSKAQENDELTEAFAEAKKLALKGKLIESFELVNNINARTKRDRYRQKLACAELACVSGKPKMGIPLLEKLLEEVRALSAADWDTDFMSKALALLVNAYDKLDKDQAKLRERQKAEAFDQLVWYDPETALK